MSTAATTTNADGCFSSPKSYAPPIKAKKLTDEELKASADRLSANHRKIVELPPLIKRQVITGDVMTKSLDRLYTSAVNNKKRMLEELDKSQHPDLVKHHQLDQEAMEGMFTRLYTKSVQQNKDSLEKLKAKYMPDFNNGTKLSKEQIGESAKRLCNESMDSSKESHAKLFDKYVLATSPKFRKLTPEEVKASADRLCAKK